jgi:tight adherence protein B
MIPNSWQGWGQGWVLVVFALSVAVLAWLLTEWAVQGWGRYQTRFAADAQRQTQALFWHINPRRLWAMHLATLGCGASLVWLLVGNVWWVLVVCLGLLAGPRWVYRALRWRRHSQLESQVPDALLSLAGALRAGAGLAMALQTVVQQTPAPLGQELGLLLREQRVGLHLDACLLNLQHRVPTPTVGLVVAAMRIAGQTGGGLADTLERTAHTVRSKLHMEGKVQALTAQGKLQAWVVGLLPLVLMAVLDHMEPTAMAQLWHTPLGWATLAVVATLELLGVYTIRRIVAIDI